MLGQVSAFERKLFANPEAEANYDALSDRAKRVLLDHFVGMQRNVIHSVNWSDLVAKGPI